MGEARLGNVAGALWLGESSPPGLPGDAVAEASDLEQAATLLASVFDEVWLVGGVPATSLPGFRVAEPEAPPGALGGLAGALAAAEAERVLMVSAGRPGPILARCQANSLWSSLSAPHGRKAFSDIVPWRFQTS